MYNEADIHTWRKTVTNYMISKCRPAKAWMQWAVDMHKNKIEEHHIVELGQKIPDPTGKADPVELSEQVWAS